MRALGLILAASVVAACTGAGEAGPAKVAPASGMEPKRPEGGWTARVSEGVCILEAGIETAKVQFVVRPATVAFAMGRFDRAGPRLDAFSTAEMTFTGDPAAWTLSGVPVAPGAFGLSRSRRDGLDIVSATLAGGEFGSPQLALAFSVPPAGKAGEAFLTCIATLPTAEGPRGT